MSKYFEPDTAFGRDAECAVCCCLWTDPVEVSKCQHIFCRACVEGLDTCPVCCGPVDRVNTPGKFILRLLDRTQGKCSACAWKGTYKDFTGKHHTCLKEGDDGGSGEDTSPTSPECAAMQAYYLEDTGANTAPPAAATPSPPTFTPARAPQPAPTQTARPYQYNNHTSATGGGGSDSNTGNGSPTYQQRERWRTSLTSTARDYGMPEKEFAELVTRFPDFATNVDHGSSQRLELSWRSACRLLRYFNYPNHPDDVKNLFEMTSGATRTESVPFHTLCLWLMMNRRNAAQWYNMTAAPYQQMLGMAKLLDVQETGLFTLDQCRILAEQYFERDVSDEEWRQIEPLLRGKDAGIRQSFLHKSRQRASLSESFSLTIVKLPLHDALCCFARHVDALKTVERQSQQQSAQADYIRRIKRIVSHYEPPAVPNLETTLQKFRGEEESLLMTLKAMYGPEPA